MSLAVFVLQSVPCGRLLIDAKDCCKLHCCVRRSGFANLVGILVISGANSAVGTVQVAPIALWILGPSSVGKSTIAARSPWKRPDSEMRPTNPTTPGGRSAQVRHTLSTA